MFFLVYIGTVHSPKKAQFCEQQLCIVSEIITYYRNG